MPTRTRAPAGEESMINGLLGLLILIADVWAILNIVQSRESNGTKAIWIVVIVLLPVLGLLIWYFAGPKST
jgi:succinate dehydrogenase/fumarate reductase cytochrome b subunit